MRRRTYLAAVGLTTGTLFAGCNTNPASDNNASANSSEGGGGGTDAASEATPTESTISGGSAPATQVDTIETSQQTQSATVQPEGTATQIVIR